MVKSNKIKFPNFYNSVITNRIAEILEIDESASQEEVKGAFRKMANKYHPDKVSHLGKEMQTSAEEKFKAVNNAYHQLKKDRNMS